MCGSFPFMPGFQHWFGPRPVDMSVLSVTWSQSASWLGLLDKRILGPAPSGVFSGLEMVAGSVGWCSAK
jgi:hypothetical protein